MTRKIILILLVALGVPVQLWLLNSAIYWAWASQTPNVNVAWTQRNFNLCTAPCFAIFLAQIAATLFVIYPRFRASHRAARGLCVQCGYNLTGNVTGRCPECGTPT